jgi:hypothetical protein
MSYLFILRRGAMKTRNSPTFYRVFFVIACFLSTLSAAAAERKLTSAQEYDMWRLMFSTPISKDEFDKSVIPLIRKNGFTSEDNMSWKMRDSTGSVLLVVYPEQGSFWIHYYPSMPTSIGDAALAAIINKAESLEISDGDSMTIAVSRQNSKTGSCDQYLKFNLHGGAWQETIAHIKWAK